MKEEELSTPKLKPQSQLTARRTQRKEHTVEVGGKTVLKYPDDDDLPLRLGSFWQSISSAVKEADVLFPAIVSSPCCLCYNGIRYADPAPKKVTTVQRVVVDYDIL